MLAWDALSGLDAYRITEIPRRPEPGPAPADSDDPGRTQRLAALVAAYHAGALLAPSRPGGPISPDPPWGEATPPNPLEVGTKSEGAGALAIGWVRHDTDGPVQLLAAGPAWSAARRAGRSSWPCPAERERGRWGAAR